MRSRDGAKRPCLFCGALSSFEMRLTRAKAYSPVCVPCGETPARRTKKKEVAA